jgi:3-oxoacyl-[acyl-carrier-protein] synthase II
MTALVITGTGAVSAAGVGMEALVKALAEDERPRADPAALYPDPLPYQAVPALSDFSVRALLGRKGTSFFDRATSLAVVACGQAIEDSQVTLGEQVRCRMGVALGTTVGSLRSSSEYSRETLVAERPYLVNPVLFPNTVMNCAAGQAAIWHKLHGVNSTVAGGRLGFLDALRYAVNLLRRKHADAMLVGAVEEFTPQRAWAHYRLGAPGLPGEAAAVFMLERSGAILPDGRPPLAELAAVTGGFHPGGDPAGLGQRLAECVGHALHLARLSPSQVRYVGTSECQGPGDEQVAKAALGGSLPAAVRSLDVAAVLGDCGAVSAGLQLAALLARYFEDPAPAVLAGWTVDGGYQVAVIKEPAHAGAHRQ